MAKQIDAHRFFSATVWSEFRRSCNGQFHVLSSSRHMNGTLPTIMWHGSWPTYIL